MILHDFLDYHQKNERMMPHFATFCDSVIFMQRMYRIKRRRAWLKKSIEIKRKETKQEPIVLNRELRALGAIESIILVLFLFRREKVQQNMEAM